MLNNEIMSQLLNQVQKKQVSSFPLHPIRSYNYHLASTINNFITLYHSSQWIGLQDTICYCDSQGYLKRFYGQQEFNNKIKLLGQYYRYHEEMARIFIPGVQRILEANTDDKRALEYDIVTKEMKVEDQIGSIRTTKRGQCQKIIKDVQLSYADFEERNRNIKDKENVLKESKNKEIRNNDGCRGMTRVDSITSKGAFLVLKPRNNNLINKQQIDKKSKMVETKYKKPKVEKKVKKQDGQKKQNSTRNKKALKLVSNNNSLGSNQGLSRSKSKVQLNTLKANNLPEKKHKLNQQTNPYQITHKFSSNSNSKQKVLVKNMSRKNVFSDKKSSIQILTRRPSRTDLKSEKYYSTNQYSKAQRYGIVSSQVQEKVKVQPEIQNRIFDKQSNEATTKQNATKHKKMFSRVIQIKKKV